MMNRIFVLLLILITFCHAQSWFLEGKKDAFSGSMYYGSNGDVHHLGMDLTYSYRARMDIGMSYSGDVPGQKDIRGNYLIPTLRYFILRQLERKPVSIYFTGAYLFENHTYADADGKKIRVRGDGLVWGGGVARSFTILNSIKTILLIEYWRPNITVRSGILPGDHDLERFQGDWFTAGLDWAFRIKTHSRFIGGLRYHRFEEAGMVIFKAGVQFEGLF